MKPRVQSSFLLLVTLLIGMLLGALIQSSLRSNRINHMRMLRSEETFITQIERAIRPQSETQASEIRTILAEYSPSITGAVRENRDRVRAQMEVLESKLFPLLDQEQQMRLKKRLHPPKRNRDEDKPD